MRYTYNYGVTREGLSKLSLLLIAIAFAFTAATSIFAAVSAGPKPSSNAGSIGKVTVGADVSEWNVGSGQSNGEFVVAEGQGIELGLRAQERFEGLLEVTGDKGNRVGVYEAETGSTGGNNGTWNYDWHVDLSNAKGNAKGKTLADYKLVLEQDFTEQSLFGLFGSDPVRLFDAEIPTAANCNGGTLTSTLCQQSWNPGFGNDDFDPEVEGTYNLRLVLTPETFNGPPLAVSIRVNVTEQ